MFRRLSLLLLLLTSAATPAALAQSSPPSATPAAAAPAQYGVAQIVTFPSLGCKLAFQDGVTPNLLLRWYEENGKDKRFADLAAALNFLAAQGWEITPYGGSSDRYLLKRRAQ
ncbi:hypothetical protein KLP40_04285 [Hymenobacter sp. NST-14]|uniref:hypothetical protein n=1 Tax=Hymenobacter piscis TaxID=2839984 RepID=UPI001C01C47B|nr:hypothetical protein [Hymenobacter piscis]MBT9392372.1 hypothetical protein [Hymenobacter piscis]